MLLAERPIVVMENSKQTCAKELHRGKGPAILMRHNLMNCNVAIHCTLVARIVVMVACIEPWFIHVPRLYTLGGAGMPGQRLPTRKIGDVLRVRAGGMSKLQIAASLSIGPTAAGDCMRRARCAGLNWPLPEDVSDEALERLL
jgi:hypothetical protein